MSMISMNLFIDHYGHKSPTKLAYRLFYHFDCHNPSPFRLIVKILDAPN